jgi:hypothetical protein
MNPVFLHDWQTAESVFEDFEATRWGADSSHPIADKNDIEILLASYTYEDYSGNAFVLYRDKISGLLYEVNGSHCSCYGLEGQWTPEETDVKVLRHRLTEGTLGSYYGSNEYAKELTEVLDALESEVTE